MWKGKFKAQGVHKLVLRIRIRMDPHDFGLDPHRESAFGIRIPDADSGRSCGSG
jgi:hypothetical protein